MIKTAVENLQNQPWLSRLVRIRQMKDLILITLGVASASIGLKGFLLPNGFLDGGAMGVSLLLEILTGVELSLLILLVNLPFIAIGYWQVSGEFALKSSVAIVALSVLVHLLEFPVLTDDKLLIAVFGGFFLGAGIGLAIRGGAVIDGTEVLAIYMSRRTSLTVGDFIAVFNVLLFSVAVFVTDMQTAMYAMLTYFAASKTVDFLINGIEEYIGVTIVTHHAEIICDAITYKLGRGVTAYKSEAGHGKSGRVREERLVLFCVVTRLEVTKLVLEVEKIDPDAFIVQHPIRDTKGGMIKKRPLH
jgi:uncharacterized membrane-anchored protein YitT (DUF2179 family)